MCSCKEANGFKEKLHQAKTLTEQTGEIHVVYVHKAVKHAFIRKEIDLTDALGICCYYLPDGTEKPYIPSSGVSEMNVEGAEVVSKTKRQGKNAKKNTEQVQDEQATEATAE